MTFTVSELSIYPVKSMSGITLKRMMLDPRGPIHDRCWMVVDAKGHFITQRQFPKLCLIDTTISSESLILTTPGMSELVIPIGEPPAAMLRTNVVVWKDTVEAVDCGDDSAAWLTSYLDKECRLMFMPQSTQRLVDTTYADQSELVSFADGFPLLITTEASLRQLNRELLEQGSHTQIGMQRFRPNIVISDGAAKESDSKSEAGLAYVEDSWQQIQIGGIVFSLVKPCSRCVIPSIDPVTALKQVEILDVLNKTRRKGRKIMFGQNALHSAPGEISVGDPVTILS